MENEKTTFCPLCGKEVKELNRLSINVLDEDDNEFGKTTLICCDSCETHIRENIVPNFSEKFKDFLDDVKERPEHYKKLEEDYKRKLEDIREEN